MSTNSQMTMEAAQYYNRIEVQCSLSQTTFSKVRLVTSDTREANLLRLTKIREDIKLDASKVVTWAKTENRTELEKIAARSYYRNLCALYDRCSDLIKLCTYEQGVIS